MRKLSILIPVFNEEKTIAVVLQRVNKLSLGPIKKEIIIIDDGSSDRTLETIRKFAKIPGVVIIASRKNQGKGSAVRKGIERAKGDYIIIQDADLEYNPSQIPSLLQPILEKKAEVVYGTRLRRLPNFKEDERSFRFAMHYFGNRFLSLLTSILYMKWVTDIETCYKVFPAEFAKNLKLKARSFDFEPEITSQILKSNLKLIEIPIKTNPRNLQEGKKLDTVTDGIAALATILRQRFSN